jgi:GT2 family glycosyltransferase
VAYGGKGDPRLVSTPTPALARTVVPTSFSIQHSAFRLRNEDAQAGHTPFEPFKLTDIDDDRAVTEPGHEVYGARRRCRDEHVITAERHDVRAGLLGHGPYHGEWVGLDQVAPREARTVGKGRDRGFQVKDLIHGYGDDGATQVRQDPVQLVNTLSGRASAAAHVHRPSNLEHVAAVESAWCFDAVHAQPEVAYHRLHALDLWLPRGCAWPCQYGHVLAHDDGVLDEDRVRTVVGGRHHAGVPAVTGQRRDVGIVLSPGHVNIDGRTREVREDALGEAGARTPDQGDASRRDTVSTHGAEPTEYRRGLDDAPAASTRLTSPGQGTFRHVETEGVTVVVVTRNRCDQLRTCLAALVSLPDRPGVIVVDNASTDDTSTMVRLHFPEVRIIRLERNAGATGRNLGVASATTDVVAFTDDDSRWEPGSLRRANELFHGYPRLGLIAARTLVGSDQRVDPVSAFMQTAPLGRDHDLPGPSVLGFLACSAVVRRAAFLAVDGFDPITFFMGEEARVAYDLAEAGWGLAYCSDVVALHDPVPGYRPDRVRLADRNRALTSWMRRPVSVALRDSARLMAQALRCPHARKETMQLGARLPAALARRRRPNRDLERSLQTLERSHNAWSADTALVPSH